MPGSYDSEYKHFLNCNIRPYTQRLTALFNQIRLQISLYIYLCHVTNVAHISIKSVNVNKCRVFKQLEMIYIYIHKKMYSLIITTDQVE